ncbi:MAG: hypothetical protein ACK5LY_10440 [Lachnospirales bacterium]
MPKEKHISTKKNNNARNVIIFLIALVVISLVVVSSFLNSEPQMSIITVSAFESVNDSSGNPKNVFTTMSLIGEDKTMDTINEVELQRTATILLKEENLDDLYTEEGAVAFGEKIKSSLDIPAEVDIMMTDFAVGSLADISYQSAYKENNNLSNRAKYMDGLFGNLKGDK